MTSAGPGGGQVVTFYSFKGGTGRTLALANVACVLARRQAQRDAAGRPVLIVDWDLEAPGLHQFFPAPLSGDGAAAVERVGLLDLLEAAVGRSAASECPTPEADDDEALAFVERLDLPRYVRRTQVRGVALLPAGRPDAPDYAGRVAALDWMDAHARMPWLWRALARAWSREHAFTLVDSRTGFTDAAGICAALVPEKLVVVFTPSRQSLSGVEDLVRRAVPHRRTSSDLRPLAVFPLPSRIERAEPSLLQLWRHGGDNPRGAPGYQPLFEKLLGDVYEHADCRLGAYFDAVEIPHESLLAYGERLVVVEDQGSAEISPARVYERIAERLELLANPWDDLAQVQALRKARACVDEAWSLLGEADAGLEQARREGRDEALHAARATAADRRELARSRVFGALDELDRTGSTADAGAAEVLANLADRYAGDSAWDAAFDSATRALGLVERDPAATPLRRAEALGRMADLARGAGRLDAAAEHAQRALEAAEAVLAHDAARLRPHRERLEEIRRAAQPGGAGFDVAVWKRRVAARLRAWRAPQAGETSVYAALSAAALWPLVEAVRGGDIVSAFVALGSLAGGGANTIAAGVQRWADPLASRPPNEDDVAAWVAETAPRDPLVREALDALLDKLEAVGEVQAALAPDARGRFDARLRDELQALGNLERFARAVGGATNVTVGGGVEDSVVIAGSDNQVHTGTGHQIRMGPGGRVVLEGPAVPDARHALARYREHLLRERLQLPLRGLDPRAGDPASGESLGLAEVYVDLDTTAQREERPARRARRPRAAVPGPGPEMAEQRPLSALEALLRERRLVLRGEPGAGKSTFLSFVTLCLAGHGLRPGEGWLARLAGWPSAEADVLPIPVVLRDFVQSLSDGASPQPSDLWTFIEQWLESQRLGAAAGPLEQALDQGAAIVFLDGLDEVPSDARRTVVRDAVGAFAERYRRSRFVVTCRTLSYQDPAWQLAGWPAFALAPFDDERVKRFIQAWYAELARLGRTPSADARAQSEELLLALDNPGLAALTRNPLLLTQMALVHTYYGRLPDARAQLYEKTVDLLLWRWDEGRLRGASAQRGLRALLSEVHAGDADLLSVLRRLAFEAHGSPGDGGTADISEERLHAALRELHPQRSRDWAAAVVEAMKLRAGLLIERAPGVYAFPHRTFQEYLAGSHLSAQAGFAAEAARLLGEGAFWREVVLLAVGRLMGLGDSDRPLMLVEELCPEDDGIADDAAARRAWNAGEVLAEVGVQRAAGGQAARRLTGRVRAALVQVVSGGHLEPVERAAAADTLARVGDPRFNADAWYLPDDPLLGFVEIPAGPFTMGKGDEAHEVSLPAYYIGRYPVTVAQFRAFKEDGGDVGEPDALRGGLHHPVVWVSWREARAYAAWLTAKLRAWPRTPEPLAGLLRRGTQGKPWSVALASEAEWEKAARGEDGRPYPWGRQNPDPSRANYRDAGIGGTSAVGCFPRGASPYGVQDLSGNVWEWTRSVAQPYPYVATDGREDLSTPDDKGRVLRGGAFNNESTIVRCAVRLRNHPQNRNDLIGFRVVVSPFTSGL